MDCGMTPQILVNAIFPGVEVPREFVTDGTVVFNIHDQAVGKLNMNNEYVSFSARFSGVSREIFVPVDSIIGIYTRENGQGMFFEAPSAPKNSDSEEITQPDKAESVENNDDPTDDNDSSTPAHRKPNLRIV